MKKEDLYRAFNEIDEKYIEEALSEKPKKSHPLSVRKLAITFSVFICLIMTLVAFNTEKPAEVTIISSYNPAVTQSSNHTQSYSANEQTVENGQVICSEMLKLAIDNADDNEKDGSINYKIIVKVYSDSNQINVTDSLLKKEVARLKRNGCNTFIDKEVNELIVITDYNKLSDFHNDSRYGYLLMFYDEIRNKAVNSDIEK